MENLSIPSVSEIKETVMNFDPSKYVDYRFLTPLALIGAYKIGYEVLYVPGMGFWTHYL